MHWHVKGPGKSVVSWHDPFEGISDQWAVVKEPPGLAQVMVSFEVATASLALVGAPSRPDAAGRPRPPGAPSCSAVQSSSVASTTVTSA